MIKDEVLIGRQVGEGHYLVESKYNSVSRTHAKLVRKLDGLYIEDLDSVNGTFVNGMNVKSKKVTSTDSISVGGQNGFPLNLKDVLKLLPMSETEFSQQFLRLQQIYDDYQVQSSELQTKGQESMMTKRMLPTMLLGTLTTILTVFAGDNTNAKIGIGLSGAVLTVLVFMLATKWASYSNKVMKDKLISLNENFELDYVCPACGVSFRGKSWEFLRRMGKCPACHREF